MTTRQPMHDVPGQPVGDDFTQIRGIGPGIANRLHNAGILRFTQLASLSPEEIVAATGELIGLTVERVEQQDWAGQARELSEIRFEPLTDENGDHLHYATFTAELLLDAKNRVRRTRLVDVRAGVEDAWAGWDADRIVRFLIEQSSLNDDAETETELAEAEAPAPAPETQTLGMMEIEQVATLHTETGQKKHILPSDYPFTLALALDLSQARLPRQRPLHCQASVQAKELSSGQRLVLAEWDEISELQDEIDFSLQHPGLPVGVYRLEAAAVIAPAGPETLPETELAAFLEGEILQMF